MRCDFQADDMIVQAFNKERNIASVLSLESVAVKMDSDEEFLASAAVLNFVMKKSDPSTQSKAF